MILNHLATALVGPHDNAIARYQLATEINPSAQIFTRAGAYLRKYEQHIDSIQMFQKAAELKPSANAYTYWGMALRASGRPKEARERFQQAIETDRSSPNGYNQLGLMYLEQKNCSEAVENFSQAIRLSPQWSNYYYNLSLAFRCDNKVKEATDAINKTIEIYKSHPKARMVLEELEGEGPPKVDQTTVGQAYALIPNAGEAGRPRGRGKGSKGERVKALRTSAGAG